MKHLHSLVVFQLKDSISTFTVVLACALSAGMGGAGPGLSGSLWGLSSYNLCTGGVGGRG